MPDSFVETYRLEAEELLAEIEQSALLLKAGQFPKGDARQTINGIFRAVHTIKGSGSMVGLEQVAAFTHCLETLLDQVHAGRVAISAGLVEIILASVDHIKGLLAVECGDVGAPRKNGERLLEEIRFLSQAGSGRGEAVETKVELEAVTDAARPTSTSTVRVPAARLDRLLHMVGELVTNQSRLTQAASQVEAPALVNPVQEIERLVAELRDSVLSIRMLPIGTLFGRFQRLVHDLSAELRKEADLVAEGAETEIDKSVLDRLGEPLMHMLRNSLDHGIEPMAERLQKGKPRRGVIRLSAAHKGSHVVISIEDDGRGINRLAVRAKALEKHMIAADKDLSAQDVLNLIFLPGFSTARRVTTVSGRGVGMDVVKKQIEALRGTLTVDSQEGRGTRISLALPLTLAIIEGLVVEVGQDRFIIPMWAITENVELPRRERSRNNGRNVVAIRGEPVTYIDLREAFNIAGDPPAIEKVVIVRQADERVGFVVDRITGVYQTVVQPLGRFFRHIDVVSGASILGDGCVALILDIPAVIRSATRVRTSRQLSL